MSIGYYAFALFIAGLICLIAIICKVLFGNVKRKYKLLDEKENKLLQLYQTVESIMEEFSDQVKAATDEIKLYENRAASIAASLTQPTAEPAKTKPAQTERPQRAESSRTELQRTESPRAESSRTELQRTESHRIESPRIESPRTESPRTESPRTELHRTESPRTESLRTELQRTESPRTESPRIELPRNERTDSNRSRAINRVVVKSEPPAKSEPQAQKASVAPADNNNGTAFQRYYDETLIKATPTAAEINKIQARSETILSLAEDGNTDAQIARELGITQNEVKLIIGINRKRV